MRALINAAPLYGKGAGARTYTAGLLRGLSASDADMEWHVLLRAADYQRLGLATDPRFHRLPFPGPAAPPNLAGARFLWRNAVDQLVIPTYGRRYDVAHYLDTYGPLLGAGAPFALTVHDLFPITRPDYFSPWVARYLAMLMRVIPRAAAYMAVSHETARALTEVFAIPPERIHVVYHGVDARFQPASATERAAAAQRYAIAGPYVIVVGAVEARKNLARIVRAFARARSEASLPHQLLIAGKPGHGYQEIVAAIRAINASDAIHLLGYVPDGDLTPLISGADALVQLALEEGFGLPVIEGMACGAPVITTAAGAQAEVAGSAARRVDPRDEDAMTATLIEVLKSPATQARLRAVGLERARQFTWGAVAEAAISAYREAASARR